MGGTKVGVKVKLLTMLHSRLVDMLLEPCLWIILDWKEPFWRHNDSKNMFSYHACVLSIQIIIQNQCVPTELLSGIKNKKIT